MRSTNLLTYLLTYSDAQIEPYLSEAVYARLYVRIPELDR